jgi:hypothetical protein
MAVGFVKWACGIGVRLAAGLLVWSVGRDAGLGVGVASLRCEGWVPQGPVSCRRLVLSKNERALEKGAHSSSARAGRLMPGPPQAIAEQHVIISHAMTPFTWR